jgi:hypothetical protein
MAFLLRGKNPTLPNIRQSPDYLKYYAEGMVGNSGAQIPEEYRADVLAALYPVLQQVKTDKRLTELLRMSGHTCTRDMIQKNIELKRPLLENADLEEEDKKQVRDSLVQSIVQVLVDGFYMVEKGKFTFDAKGKINGIIPTEQGRMTACHTALQSGESLDILEEGGRRRRVSRASRRARKTLRKRKSTKRTKTAKGV